MRNGYTSRQNYELAGDDDAICCRTMTDRLRKLRTTILAALPESNLKTLGSRELVELVERYPDLPEHLRQLFTVLGVGSIGDGRYMIHQLLTPDEVYDPETARALDGIVLVGDDFAGTCEAYDTKRGWKFGCIEASGKFSPDAGSDFIAFLEDWYGDLVAD